MSLIELSHRIVEGMITYPGIPAPVMGVHLSREASRDLYAEGTEFFIGTITMAANTGTYLDSPNHRFADGADLSGLPLEKLADLDGVVVKGVDLPGDLDVAGKAVLFHTGWDANWGTDAYFTGHPHLTAETSAALVAGGAALVGIDSFNIDATPPKGERPAHTTLLGAGIPIVEHLTNLGALPASGFRFHAAPPLVAGMGTFPVRAYAVV
ncbi:cyclase family protein [Herbidospora sp. NEAU-GS84]|uniref:Cyclase family protein n=1 Tax=Herbidospora solisilvae TaxID=2696284 RepID=A0A7C9NEN8_9ACTN|nr:cyclase family protein [Herbidospora solisilvae]NAS22915.1 cyclase family protein [Herbidospora solisilvae]